MSLNILKFLALAMACVTSYAKEVKVPQYYAALVSTHIGVEATIHDGGPGLPSYTQANLSKAKLGRPELVLVVDVDRAKGKLNSRAITQISSGDSASTLDDAVGGHCLGLAIFHGMRPGAVADAPSAIYLLYECFSGYSRVRAGAPALKQVAAAGDGLLLELESGGQSLVYWKNGRYHQKLVRRGD